MFTIIGLVFAAAIAALLLAAAFRPSAFLVRRSLHIAAAPADIAPWIADLHRFNTWNPYARKGPTAITYTGPEAGRGAAFTFDGGRGGRGSLAVLDSEPDRITMQLRMTSPMRCTNTIEFRLVPRAGGTEVSWAMSGRNGLVAKLFGLFCDTDAMVGRDFEDGLAALKLQAEAPLPDMVNSVAN